MKRITIDYGTSNGKSTAPKMLGGKKGELHLYYYKKKYVYKYVLVKFDEGKLIPFIEKSLMKASDDNNLMFHNCRNSVC